MSIGSTERTRHWIIEARVIYHLLGDTGGLLNAVSQHVLARYMTSRAEKKQTEDPLSDQHLHGVQSDEPVVAQVSHHRTFFRSNTRPASAVPLIA